MELVVLTGLRAFDYILIAVGFALVFGTCRVLNLMHGSYVMLGAYATHTLTSLLLRGRQPSPVEAMLVVLAASLVVGFFGFAVFKLLQVTRRTDLNHLLAISFAGNLFISTIVKSLYGTEGISVFPVIRGIARVGGVSIPANDLLIPLAGIVAVTALWLWLYRTRSGTALRAVADNPTSARLTGVNAERALAVAVGLAAFMAALAGALRAPSQTLSPDMWIHPLLISFAVVVFGGRNSLWGAVLSAIFLAVAETGTAWIWGESTSQYVALVVIVVGLVLFPTGLVSSPRYEVR